MICLTYIYYSICVSEMQGEILGCLHKFLGAPILDCDAHTPYGIIFAQNKMELMGRRKKADGGSRHGKHAPDAFRVAIYLSAEEKAIAILTAERQGKTLSDVLRSGIVCEATRSGVLVNGVVAEKFRARISAYRQVLEAEAQTKRSTEK